MGHAWWQGGAAVDKEATLLALASSSYGNGRTIVFFSTKVAAHRAKLLFGLAELPPAAELHGNMSQTGRLEALDAFRKVRIQCALNHLLMQQSHGLAEQAFEIPRAKFSSAIVGLYYTMVGRLWHWTHWVECRGRERWLSCWRLTWLRAGWTSWAWRMSSTMMHRALWSVLSL